MERFNIIPPEAPELTETIKSRIRGMFNEDFQKNGLLAKIFVFIAMLQPMSATQSTSKLTSYYKIPFDKGTISRNMKKMAEMGLFHSITSGDLQHTPHDMRSAMQKEAYDKHQRYLETIPTQFRKKYDAVNYYWISNGMGEEFVEWCCKIIGFKFEGKK